MLGAGVGVGGGENPRRWNAEKREWSVGGGCMWPNNTTGEKEGELGEKLNEDGGGMEG